MGPRDFHIGQIVTVTAIDMENAFSSFSAVIVEIDEREAIVKDGDGTMSIVWVGHLVPRPISN